MFDVFDGIHFVERWTVSINDCQDRELPESEGIQKGKRATAIRRPTLLAIFAFVDQINETNQTNQINQINQTNQTDLQPDQPDQRNRRDRLDKPKNILSEK